VKDPSNVFKTLKFYCVNALQDIHEEMFKFFEKLEEYVKEIHVTLFIFVLYNTSIIQDV
jgi:hypothetical protein